MSRTDEELLAVSPDELNRQELLRRLTLTRQSVNRLVIKMSGASKLLCSSEDKSKLPQQFQEYVNRESKFC